MTLILAVCVVLSLLLFFWWSPTIVAADLRGCTTKSWSKMYGRPHKLAAIEGVPYALLSSNVYADTGARKFELPPGFRELPFEFSVGASDLAFALYAYRSERAFTDADAPHGKADIDNLVLVFRGTDSGQDWWAGTIRGVQYEQALALTQAVQAKYPDKKLVATGHSLGGGLALHVSMHLKGISAYAFNPSPLTHAPAQALRNRRVIYWETGDPLHYARAAWAKAPNTIYWKFTFVEDNGHNSAAMAKGLLTLAATMNKDYAKLLKTNCAIAP